MSSAKDKIIRKNGKFYKLVPPDGGWGYMIAISLIILMVVMTGPAGCFGILYNDFFEANNISTTAITMMNGLMFLSFSLSAFMTNMFLKRWTLKQVGLAGAIVCSFGNFGAIFITSLYIMTCTCILIGSGCGLMITCIYTVFNMYFEKKRVFMMAVCQTLISIITIAYPPLINLAMQKFGFRGTMAIIFAIGLHCILAFIVVQPVEKHMILEEINTKELGFQGELEPLTANEKEVVNDKSSKEELHQDVEQCQTKMIRSKMMIISDFLDLSMFEDLVFVNICIGISVVIVSDANFVALLPLHFYGELWSGDQVALMMTLLLVGDTVARAALAFISKFFAVNSRILFLAGVFIMTIIRFIMFNSHNVSTVTGLVTVLGFFRCMVLVTYTLILADHVPMEKYAAAQGLQMLITGVLCVVGGPMTGGLKDLTGSYLACFHVLTGMLLICLIPWTVELVIKWRTLQSKNRIKGEV